MESDAEAEAEVVTLPEQADAPDGTSASGQAETRQPGARQPVAVQEELLAACGQRLLHAAVLLGADR